MSMTGPNGGGEGDEAPLFTEINVTPLTDIFLVLLIIFMVTATGLSAAALDVALPKVVTAGSLDASGVVTVSLDAHEKFFVGKDAVPVAELEAAIREALKAAKDPAVILAGDRTATLEQAAKVLAAAKRAGAKKFAIAVARAEERGGTTGTSTR